MKRLSYSRYFGAAVVFGICLVSLTGNSFADSRHFEHGHGWDSHYEHFRQPYFYRHLPPGFLALQIADELFYYAEGIYYQETPSGYVIVSAPRGAVITRLPERHKVIVYDNTDYYYYNDAYYVKEPQGYTVVTPPPQVVSSNPPAAEAPEKTVVVQVPNPNGSFIPVTLQKYSDGYRGPNGEFYPDYPTIDQLKAMYSKTSAAAEAPAKDEEINYDVPNTNGSFMKVKILKTKDGYVGPEGEFYPQKPTVEQLKAMYAKGN